MTAAASHGSSRMMSWSRRTWITIVASAALVAFAIYAAVHWVEVVDETEWVGIKGEAATNPFLALERLLAAQGATLIPVPRAAVLDAQLQSGAANVMVLGASRLQTMSPDRVKAIEAWVASGGQLIVEAERVMLDDPLLARWGLDRKRIVWRRGKYVEVDRRAPPTAANEDRSNAGEDATNEPQLEFELDEGQQPTLSPRSPFAQQRSMPSQSQSVVRLVDGMTFKVAFVPHLNLVVSDEGALARADPLAAPPRGAQAPLIRDRFGGRIAEISIGRGRVTAISGFGFMKWKALTKGDHAEFIWHLVSRGSNYAAVKPTVLMMARPVGTGFSQWVIENAWMVLLSLLLLIAVWIWSVLPRFGPLLPPMTTERRSLGEHIRAAGGWLASRREWSALVEPVRARFWARLIHRFPRAANMSLPDRLELAARATSLSVGDTARLLSAEVRSRRECLQIISSLIDATARLDGDRSQSTQQFAP